MQPLSMLLSQAAFAALVLPLGCQARSDSAQQVRDATDNYTALLKETRYFDYIADHAHGWPDNAVGPNAPSGTVGGGYATWWSGVTVQKTHGIVTFLHGHQGSDNNGIHTAPLLEGACFASVASPRLRNTTLPLLDRLIRGFSSWVLAMERGQDTGNPSHKTILTRAAYPVSVKSSGGLVINYTLDRPGLDNGACGYVHIPDNHYWGDMWVKDRRSKDDIGHMFRAIANVNATCGHLLAEKTMRTMTDLCALAPG